MGTKVQHALKRRLQRELALEHLDTARTSNNHEMVSYWVKLMWAHNIPGDVAWNDPRGDIYVPVREVLPDGD